VRHSIHGKAAVFCMMAGPEVGVSSACGVRRSCRGDPWAGSVPRERVAATEDQWGGESVARSLRNCDAGDSDARHLADRHLEQ
jgi:hypothetical protein